MRTSKKRGSRPSLHVTGLLPLPAQIPDWEWELLVPLLISLCADAARPARTEPKEVLR